MTGPTDTFTGNRAFELAENRRSTRDLIESEGAMVQLLRGAERVSDGAGGFVEGSGEPEPQTPRKRFFSLVAADPTKVVLPQGELVQERFVLIGLYDDDIQEGDFFYYQGEVFTVAFVHPDRSYQVKAEGRVVTSG